ncbi:MAG TPA: alpha/beta hydrolase-fold protein [Lacisediminihabitans sp.]|uniref:alpha/beta hydrolase n=1 Tax=Lacisediminihabitans sp. TaxID=2787631 RepID=UPI002ED94B06
MSSTLAIDPQAVAWSVPETGRAQALASRPLLVLMHGRGSHEQDLFTLVPLLPKTPVIASVRAPMPLGDGYTWFPLGDAGDPSTVAAAAATEAVLEWLDTVQTSTRIGLLGFSQGGAMALHLMRHAPERFASYVTLSGFSISGELPADASLESSRPPVFWGRDPADPVIPTDAVERTSAWLPGHATLTERHYPGIGHSISREELDDVNAFLRSSLLGR